MQPEREKVKTMRDDASKKMSQIDKETISIASFKEALKGNEDAQNYLKLKEELKRAPKCSFRAKNKCNNS